MAFPAFKLWGITYLVGKISRSNFYFQGPGRLSECVYDRVFVFGDQKKVIVMLVFLRF